MATWEAQNTPGIVCDWKQVPDGVQEKVFTLAFLVLTTIQALVEDEDGVRVNVAANHRRVMFTVRVVQSDVGLAIGKQGCHANALRLLLAAACRKLQFHFDMDIGGPSGEADWSSD